MYVISLLFLLASVVSLLMGLRQGGLTLVFVSIGSSVLASLFLGASVLRARSDGETEQEATRSTVHDWRGTPTRESESSELDVPLAAEPLVGVVDRPLAGRHRPKAEIPFGAVRPDAESSGVLGPDVVVAMDRYTYHLPGCEQARGRSAGDRMKRAVAKRLGYMPCGVCRPG